MTTTRELTLHDLVELEKRAQFPLDFLVNKPKIVQKTFEDESGLIGSVIVCSTVELNAIFADRSDRSKIKMMKELPDTLLKDLHPKGYRDIRVTTIDPKFADILVKHFDFQYAKGYSLFRRY